MSQKYSKKQEKTIIEIIFVGIFQILWFLIKLPFRGIKKQQSISVEEKNEIIARRSEIRKLLESNNKIELKHAVLEADKLVDQVLKLKGYAGETFADRLKSAEQNIDYNTYQSIWQGHKVRNRIAHENGEIEARELKSAVDNLLKYVKQI